MKIFISGATGYIGQKLVQKALEKNMAVHALVRNGGMPGHPGIKYFCGDVADLSSIEAAMEGCEMAIHTAAFTRLTHRNRRLLYSINVDGTKNILEASARQNIQKLVFTSSGAVLGPSQHLPLAEDDPRLTPFENDYEISKHCAEQLVREYARTGLNAVIVRPTRVYGPGAERDSNVVTNLINGIIRRGLAFMPNAKNIRGNYAFIDDVIDGHFLALQSGHPGETYNLGGENVDYQKFFSTVAGLAGKNINLLQLPKTSLLAAGYVSSMVSAVSGTASHFSANVVRRLYNDRAVSCDKAIRELGYTITPFEEGIRQTIQYLKSRK